MVVLQALSEYLVKRPPPDDLNLLVQLSVPGRSDVRWTFNPKVAYVARSSRVRSSVFQNVILYTNMAIYCHHCMVVVSTHC